MKIFCTFPTVNISKLIFLLVICIAKNLIWTTLKTIFSIFRFFCTQILSNHNKPYINVNIIYSAFSWRTNLNFEKLALMSVFVVQGHKHAFNWSIVVWLNSFVVTCSSGYRTDTQACHRQHPPLPHSRCLQGDCTPESGTDFSWREEKHNCGVNCNARWTTIRQMNSITSIHAT